MNLMMCKLTVCREDSGSRRGRRNRRASHEDTGPSRSPSPENRMSRGRRQTPPARSPAERSPSPAEYHRREEKTATTPPAATQRFVFCQLILRFRDTLREYFKEGFRSTMPLSFTWKLSLTSKQSILDGVIGFVIAASESENCS